MQAVILAGGLGTRLRPFTENVPKVMLPVRGEPFMVHLLRLLRKSEIRDIILCTGYLGGQVKDYLGAGEGLGMTIRYSEEKGRLLGTGGALKQARAWLDESFYVVNGDTYLPVNYGEIEKQYLSCGKKALMVVGDNAGDTATGKNVALDGLTVVRHQKHSASPGLEYVDAGVQVISREVLDFIKNGAAVSLEAGLYPCLIRQGELAACITRQRFYDIGTPERLRVFEEFLERSSR